MQVNLFIIIGLTITTLASWLYYINSRDRDISIKRERDQKRKKSSFGKSIKQTNTNIENLNVSNNFELRNLKERLRTLERIIKGLGEKLEKAKSVDNSKDLSKGIQEIRQVLNSVVNNKSINNRTYAP